MRVGSPHTFAWSVVVKGRINADVFQIEMYRCLTGLQHRRKDFLKLRKKENTFVLERIGRICTNIAVSSNLVQFSHDADLNVDFLTIFFQIKEASRNA